MDLRLQNLLALILIVSLHTNAATISSNSPLNAAQTHALQNIDEVSKQLKQSLYFKKLLPDSFVAQLATRISKPYELNQGKTVFCWLAAPLAYFYAQDPEGMAMAVINLYHTGWFRYTNCGADISFAPSQEVMDAVGSDIFSNKKDPLTGREVDQMVFLAFADNYKCWINIDRHFDPGDQNKSAWGGGTLGK